MGKCQVNVGIGLVYYQWTPSQWNKLVLVAAAPMKSCATGREVETGTSVYVMRNHQILSCKYFINSVISKARSAKIPRDHSQAAPAVVWVLLIVQLHCAAGLSHHSPGNRYGSSSVDDTLPKRCKAIPDHRRIERLKYIHYPIEIRLRKLKVGWCTFWLSSISNGKNVIWVGILLPCGLALMRIKWFLTTWGLLSLPGRESLCSKNFLD